MVRTVFPFIVAFCFASRLLAQADSTDDKNKAALTDPKRAVEKAPEKFQAKVATTKGDFVIEVTREWSPNGADRFYNLVKIGFFQDIAIFRAIKGFMFQFGIHGDPKISRVWSEANIKDDKYAGVSNKKGFITYAKSGRPNSRSTQFFINLSDNASLDRQGFTPFGRVVKGMDVVEKINTQYGENSPEVQGMFQARGNDYIKKRYPNLDYIKSISLVKKKAD